MKVLFVVGAPGVGKTTLVRELLEHRSYFSVEPKWTMGMNGEVCAAGLYTGAKFDGADTVPYNGVQAALEFWADKLKTFELTILDGDRFSYKKTVDFFRAQGADVRCLLLDAGDALLAERRAARGTEQNETWVKGRVTKARNFFDELPDNAKVRFEVESDTAPTALAALVRSWLRSPSREGVDEAGQALALGPGRGYTATREVKPAR